MKRRWGTLCFMMVALIIMLMPLAGCGGTSAGETAVSRLTVKVLDVGQGDAILIRTSEETILVDAGDTDEAAKLTAALEKEGIKTIDKLIITHPHRDHLGGSAMVFQNYIVRAVYDNGQPATPKFYRDYLKMIKAKNIPYKTLRDGDRLDFGGGVSFTVLSPTEEMVKEGGHGKDGKSNLNLNSLVGRLTYGSFAMMFTGDAEKPTEHALQKRHPGSELRCQVLKSGHHGSKTSSSSPFLKAVQPEVALISCGAGNSYHHPHASVRRNYEKHRIDFYRTDVNGTITVESDGQTYRVMPERGAKNSDKEN